MCVCARARARMWVYQSMCSLSPWCHTPSHTDPPHTHTHTQTHPSTVLFHLDHVGMTAHRSWPCCTTPDGRRRWPARTRCSCCPSGERTSSTSSCPDMARTRSPSTSSSSGASLHSLFFFFLLCCPLVHHVHQVLPFTASLFFLLCYP